MTATLRGLALAHATSPKRAARLLSLLSLLSERADVAPGELASVLGVSGPTIRRDLAELASQCLVVREHGRVRVAEALTEVPVSLKDTRFPESKRRIARRAAVLVPPGRHAVALNGGSTTAEVAKALAMRSGLTAVTNALTTAVQLASRPELRVIVNGGWLRPHSFELVGPQTESAFGAMSVGFAVLGIDGISADAGATTHDDAEARTNRAMILRAGRVIVVADGSKVGVVTRAQVAATRELHDLVTDSSAPPDQVARLRELGVRVHVVEAG